MAKRIIGAVSAMYHTDDERLLDAPQGAEVDLSTAEEERLDEQGALVPQGRELQEWLDAKMDEYRAPRGDTEAARRLTEARSGSIVDITAPASKDAQVLAFASRMRASDPSVDDTVALAEGDPEQAEAVLEAERLVSGGEPRKGVEDGLQKLIAERDAEPDADADEG